MAITRWSPFQELTNLHTTMDRLFGDMFEGTQDVSTPNMTFRLPVDISEKDDRYLIKAPVPGFKPEEVNVTVSGNVLTIAAKHQEQKEDKQGDYIRREMIVGDFERQIALPADARSENINATFDNGVLQVEVPRQPKPQPKRIEVKAEGQRQTAGSSSR
jgi:HSP20 family protein